MNTKIAIIGLGYVGLPLAHAFSEKYIKVVIYEPVYKENDFFHSRIIKFFR